MDAKRAWNYCLWLLGRRDYTEQELRERLLKKEATPETIDGIISRLTEYGFVNDRRFAASFVRSRSRQHGTYRLRGDLLRKGVAEPVVEKEIAELSETAQLEAAAALLARHAWRFTRDDDPRKGLNRAWAFLARRGYSPDVAAAALENFREEFLKDHT